MGSAVFGIPQDEALIIRDAGCRTFVETGTYKMRSTLWAADHFDSVFSVEADPERYAACRTTLATAPPPQNWITLLRGDSGKVLPDVLAMLVTPALFWLDAHYMTGDKTAAECPVLDEIAAIVAAGGNDHCILIDDARLFLLPPPPPADPGAWPDMHDLTDALSVIPGHQIIVRDDVIYSVPAQIGWRLMQDWKTKGRSINPASLKTGKASQYS